MRPLLCWALVLVALCRPALAGERPDAENMGKLLAYTVNCGCVVGERDWILETYEAAFADAYGQAYASALQAPLQGALMDGWDRNMSLCKRICDQPVTRQLQLSLAQADGGAVDGSAIRAILGPAPANEPAAGDAAAAGTETAGASAQGAAGLAPPAPEQAEEEVRLSFPPQPNYCVYRNYARGCTPAEEEVPVAVAVEPAADDLEAAGTTHEPDPGQTEIPPPAPEELAEPEEISAQAVEAAYQPPEPEEEEETSSGTRGIDVLYETAGTGDNWSSVLCRTSPSRPDCRKPGAE